MRPVLVLNPRSDRSFATAAEHLVSDGAGTPAALEARLRARYPHAAVHRRELSAEPVSVWYVYRDGHWTGSRTGEGEGGEGS